MVNGLCGLVLCLLWTGGSLGALLAMLRSLGATQLSTRVAEAALLCVEHGDLGIVNVAHCTAVHACTAASPEGVCWRVCCVAANKLFPSTLILATVMKLGGLPPHAVLWCAVVYAAQVCCSVCSTAVSGHLKQ
jgi:hypothetical protein